MTDNQAERRATLRLRVSLFGQPQEAPDTWIDNGSCERDRAALGRGLAVLLSDAYGIQLKAQNFYWNVMGHSYFNAQSSFDDQFRDLSTANALLAGRVRSLSLFTRSFCARFRRRGDDEGSLDAIDAQSLASALTAAHDVVSGTQRVLAMISADAEGPTSRRDL